jgi:hypothetical protein
MLFVLPFQFFVLSSSFLEAVSKPDRHAVALSTSKRVRGHCGVRRDLLGKVPFSAKRPPAFGHMRRPQARCQAIVDIASYVWFYELARYLRQSKARHACRPGPLQGTRTSAGDSWAITPAPPGRSEWTARPESHRRGRSSGLEMDASTEPAAQTELSPAR